MIQKLRKNIILYIILLVAFYGIPNIIQDTGTAMVTMLIILPMICLIVSMSYGMRNGFDIWYVAAVAVMFVPSIFLFYNSSAAVYIIGYAGIACIGTSIGSVFRKHYEKQTKKSKNCPNNN